MPKIKPESAELSEHWREGPAPSKTPLTPDELHRTRLLFAAFPGVQPPWPGVAMDEAVLLERFVTGAVPFAARLAIKRRCQELGFTDWTFEEVQDAIITAYTRNDMERMRQIQKEWLTMFPDEMDIFLE